MDVRRLQLNAMVRLLRQTDEDGIVEVNSTGRFSQRWKVLVFDERCKDIVSQLRTVQQLREDGVTLFMRLSGGGKRDAIPDVPALYFVYPTPENVALIKQDLEAQLYDSVLINFATPCPPAILESLADAAADADAIDVVSRVVDQSLGFVSLEPDLVTLNMKDSFFAYNRPGLDEKQVTDTLEEMALGLCSMILTTGVLPVIRAPRGGAAAMVAERVYALLHAAVNAEDGSGFGLGSSGGGDMLQRPVLVIVDRGLDLTPVLKHSQTYQACVHDLVNFRLNCVHVPTKNENEGVDGQPQQQRRVDNKDLLTLDSNTDDFWRTYSAKPFFEAMEMCSKITDQVNAAEQKIKASSSSDQDAVAKRLSEEANVGDMLSNLQSMPAILDAKDRLGKHSRILTAVKNAIADRHITYEWFTPQSIEKQALLGMIANDKLGVVDRWRLVAVYLLTANPTKEDSKEVINALKPVLVRHASESTGAGEGVATARNVTVANDFGSMKVPGPDPNGPTMEVRVDGLKALEYVDRMFVSNRGGGGPNVAGGVPSGGSASAIWGLAGHAMDLAKARMRSMVSDDEWYAATKTMDVLCKDMINPQKAAELDAQYLYLDPKVKGEVSSQARIRSGFKQGMLFMVGGGSCAEYHNLKAYGLANNRQMVYACSELVNANEMIAQLSQC